MTTRDVVFNLTVRDNASNALKQLSGLMDSFAQRAASGGEGVGSALGIDTAGIRSAKNAAAGLVKVFEELAAQEGKLASINAQLGVFAQHTSQIRSNLTAISGEASTLQAPIDAAASSAQRLQSSVRGVEGPFEDLPRGASRVAQALNEAAGVAQGRLRTSLLGVAEAARNMQRAIGGLEELEEAQEGVNALMRSFGRLGMDAEDSLMRIADPARRVRAQMDLAADAARRLNSPFVALGDHLLIARTRLIAFAGGLPQYEFLMRNLQRAFVGAAAVIGTTFVGALAKVAEHDKKTKQSFEGLKRELEQLLTSFGHAASGGQLAKIFQDSTRAVEHLIKTIDANKQGIFEFVLGLADGFLTITRVVGSAVLGIKLLFDTIVEGINFGIRESILLFKRLELEQMKDQAGGNTTSEKMLLDQQTKLRASIDARQPGDPERRVMERAFERNIAQILDYRQQAKAGQDLVRAKEEEIRAMERLGAKEQAEWFKSADALDGFNAALDQGQKYIEALRGKGVVGKAPRVPEDGEGSKYEGDIVLPDGEERGVDLLTHLAYGMALAHAEFLRMSSEAEYTFGLNGLIAQGLDAVLARMTEITGEIQLAEQKLAAARTAGDAFGEAAIKSEIQLLQTEQTRLSLAVGQAIQMQERLKSALSKSAVGGGMKGASADMVRFEGISDDLTDSLTSLRNQGFLNLTNGVFGFIEALSAGEVKARSFGKTLVGVFGQTFSQVGGGLLALGIATGNGLLIGTGAALSVVGSLMSGAARRQGGAGSSAGAGGGLGSAAEAAADRFLADNDKGMNLTINNYIGNEPLASMQARVGRRQIRQGVLRFDSLLDGRG